MRKKRRTVKQVEILFRDPQDLNYNLKETPFDVFLKWFEDEAKKILVQVGYSTDIGDLYYMLNENYPRAEARIQHAANILLLASLLKESNLTDEAKEAAVDMLKLISSAINIGLEDPIKRIEWSSRGGKATGKNETLILLIHEALKKSKNKTQNALWEYIKRNHAIKPGNDAFYSKTGRADFIDENDPFWEVYKREGILITRRKRMGRQLRDITKETFVTFSTFKRYVAEVKMKITYPSGKR